MSRWSRITLIAGSVGALVLTAAGAGAAMAPTTVTTTIVPSTMTTIPAAQNISGVDLATGAVEAVTNAPGVIVQTQYIPITPCRIVDTRVAKSGSKLSNGVSASFLVSGTTDLSAQGGSTAGCGIPIGANAIAASMTATQSAGNGYLTAWAAGTARPKATVLNYVDVGNGGVTVGSPLPIAVTTAASPQLTLVAYGASTHLVIDVLGYYREPIAGTIDLSGALTSSSNQVVSASRISGYPVGGYAVTFDQPVYGCALQLTAISFSNVVVTGALGRNMSAVVLSRNPKTGDLVDSAVAFTVTC